MRRALMVLWVSLASADANAQVPNCDDLTGLPINFQVSWQLQIKPILNEVYGGVCTGCHSLGGSPDFSDQGQDAIYKIVGIYLRPGEPARSRLMQKINCANPSPGNRMPLGGAPLSLAQQGLIYDWIRQGAYGEDPNNVIFRDFVFRDGAESWR
jgi:hypothetical protein